MTTTGGSHKRVSRKTRSRKSRKGGKSKMAADEAYCPKCKTGRKVQNPKHVTMANGRKRLAGKCATCGSNVTKFI